MKLNLTLLTAILTLTICSCGNSGKKNAPAVIYKGVYSYGPEVKSFKECETGNEFWVNDNSATMEKEYTRLNFEKPYEPVYVEVEGIKVKATKADALDSQYDSIIVVKKLVKITKVIPQDMCN
jgi:copper homeostasis protein (lipoprotein)